MKKIILLFGILILVENNISAFDLHFLGGSFVDVGYTYAYDTDNSQGFGSVYISTFRVSLLEKNTHFGIDATAFRFNFFPEVGCLYFRPLNADINFYPLIFWQHGLFVNIYIGGGLFFKGYSSGTGEETEWDNLSGDISLGFRLRRIEYLVDWAIPLNFDLFFEYSFIKKELRSGIYVNLGAILFGWSSG